MPKLITCTLYDGGRALLVNPDHIVSVRETGLSAQQSGMQTVVCTVDGKSYELRDSVSRIAEKVATNA